MSKNNSNILINGVWIGLSHLSSFIPLVTLRNIAIGVGPAGFGEIILALAFTAYVGILVDYGFLLYGSREVSIKRLEDNISTKLYWDIFNAKIILYIISLLIGFLFFFIIPNIFSFINLIALLASFNYIFYQQWHFQGISRMKDTIIPLYAYRIIALLLSIILPINSNEPIIPLLLILIPNIASALHCFTIRKKYRIGPYYFELLETIKTLKAAFLLFTSNFFISFFATYTLMLAGTMISKESLGQFAAAERLKFLFQSLMTPLSQAQFIHLNKLKKDDGSYGKSFLHFGLIQILISFSIATFLFCFSDRLIKLIYGDEYEEAIDVLKLLSIGVVLIAVSNMAGVLGLIARGDKKIYTLVLGLVAFLNIPAAYFLIKNYDVTGMVKSIILSESLVSILMVLGLVIYSRNNK